MRLPRALASARTALRRPRQLPADEPGWPPGHFYSPIPDLNEVRRRQAMLFDASAPKLPGIDLRVGDQLTRLAALGRFHQDQPWAEDSRPGLRYRFANPNFQHGEALVLYGMLRLLQPQRVVEVGSGWSSCAIVDANRSCLGNRAHCVFVDPHPQLLRELMPTEDLDVREAPVQDVEMGLFTDLRPGDVLFIDSSHVVKVGSDVNHLMLEVLPRLHPGVFVHIHDVLYPFQYPVEWVFQGRAWNETYLVHAFLAFNTTYRIELFLSYLAYHHRDSLAGALPLAMSSPGSSLWLSRA